MNNLEKSYKELDDFCFEENIDSKHTCKGLEVYLGRFSDNTDEYLDIHMKLDDEEADSSVKALTLALEKFETISKIIAGNNKVRYRLSAGYENGINTLSVIFY